MRRRRLPHMPPSHLRRDAIEPKRVSVVSVHVGIVRRVCGQSVLGECWSESV
jgi:hypothetical protein